jgi:starch synthase
VDKSKLNVLMVAAECRGLAKVGGLADVVMDLPKALLKKGVNAKVIIPYYDVINANASKIGRFILQFGEDSREIFLYKTIIDGIEIFLVKNERFFSGEYGSIYVDSGELRPFEDDAKRFAFFSSAVLKLLLEYNEFSDINVLHCHDWHTATIFTSLKYDLKYRNILYKVKTIFTIHNLDYQGIRPFHVEEKMDFGSFEEWFPNIYKILDMENTIEEYCSPGIEYPCFNAMLTGIKLADFVNTVSPTYAHEITKPDDFSKNFFGGRGLEKYLKKRLTEKKLAGILNGLDYEINNPTKLSPPYDVETGNWKANKLLHKKIFLSELPNELRKIESPFKNKEKVLKKMEKYNIEEWLKRPLFVAITRVVNQKMKILTEPFYEQTKLIKSILEKNLNLIVIGTGELWKEMNEINDYPNGIYISSFEPDMAKKLYIAGDIFLMPSDFEPCGISQMIAMRYGTLPLVHDIGGLHDTVTDMENGFVFSGTNREGTKYSLLNTIDKILFYYFHEKETWYRFQANAMTKRFEWDKSADEYIKMYIN